MVFGPKPKAAEGFPQMDVAIRQASYTKNGYRVFPFGYEHRFYFKWPFKVFYKESDDSQFPVEGYACFDVGYSFKSTVKILKENGWHNSGPDLEKHCFFFRKKDPTSGENAPISIAVKWSGEVFIWASGKTKEEKMGQLINLVTMITE